MILPAESKGYKLPNAAGLKRFTKFEKFHVPGNFSAEHPSKAGVLHPDSYRLKEETMADREIIHTTDRSGMGGMSAILGIILGVLLVGGLIFYFAGDWNRGGDKLTINVPSAPATTGSAPPRAPANPAR